MPTSAALYLRRTKATITTPDGGGGGGGGGGGSVPQSDSVVESFGINWHANFSGTYGGNQSTQYAIDALKMCVRDMGCRYIRDAAPSGKNAHVRDVHLSFINNGGKLLLLCGADRAKATSQGVANTHVDNHLDAIQWGGGTYVGGIVAFEGTNEPNNDGDPAWAQKTKWLQNAWWNRPKQPARSSGATRTDQIPVVGPGLANRAPWDKDNFTTDFTALGDMSAVCDLGNVHIYPAGINPSFKLTYVTDRARIAFPTQAIWATEAGYYDALNTSTNNQFVPDDIIAKYYPALLMEHVSAGTAKLFGYEGLDDVNPANDDVQSNWGFIETPSLTQGAWTLKPQWYAMKLFLGLMADPGPSFDTTDLAVTVTGGGSDLRSNLYQKRDGTYRLVIWRDVIQYQNGNYKTVANQTITVTLGTALAIAMHKPSGQGTALTSTPYSTLTARTSFTVTMGGSLQVLVLG